MAAAAGRSIRCRCSVTTSLDAQLQSVGQIVNHRLKRHRTRDRAGSRMRFAFVACSDRARTHAAHAVCSSHVLRSLRAHRSIRSAPRRPAAAAAPRTCSCKIAERCFGRCFTRPAGHRTASRTQRTDGQVWAGTTAPAARTRHWCRTRDAACTALPERVRRPRPTPAGQPAHRRRRAWKRCHRPGQEGLCDSGHAPGALLRPRGLLHAIELPLQAVKACGTLDMAGPTI